MQRIGDAYMVEGGLPEPRPDRDQEEQPGQNAGKRFSTARRLRLTAALVVLPATSQSCGGA
jgi:hypothetical protein